MNKLTFTSPSSGRVVEYGQLWQLSAAELAVFHAEICQDLGSMDLRAEAYLEDVRDGVIPVNPQWFDRLRYKRRIWRLFRVECERLLERRGPGEARFLVALRKTLDRNLGQAAAQLIWNEAEELMRADKNNGADGSNPGP